MAVMLLEISKHIINEPTLLEQHLVSEHWYAEITLLYLQNNVTMEVQVLVMDEIQAETLKQVGNEQTLVVQY